MFGCAANRRGLCLTHTLRRGKPLIACHSSLTRGEAKQFVTDKLCLGSTVRYVFMCLGSTVKCVCFAAFWLGFL